MVLTKRINNIIGCSVLDSRAVFRIIFPLILERFSGIVLTMIETAFLSASDPVLIEANGLISTISMLFMQFPFAICVGGAVLVAQYRGKEDYKSIRESMGQAFTFSVLSAAFFLIVALFFGKPILYLLYPTIDKDLIDSAYLLLVGQTGSLIIYAASQPMISTLSGMGDGKSWSIVNITAVALCTLCNYLFVGVLGLGILGNILALAIHRLYKIPISVFMLKRNHPELRLKIKSFFYWEREKAVKIFKIALPVCLEYIFINFALIIQASIIGSVGRVAIRANAIFQSVASFAELFLLSLTESVTAIVGRCVGAGVKKDARKMAFTIMGMSLLVSILFSLIYLPFSGKILETYNPGEEILKMAPLCLLVYILARITVFALSEISCAAVRASGDTAYCSVVSLAGNYLIMLPVGYIFGIYFNMGLLGVWIGSISYWSFRALLFIIRILSKKWCHKRLV